MSFRLPLLPPSAIAVVLAAMNSQAAEIFRVATYNLEGYLIASTETRPKKSEESKSKICESILAVKPDLLAVQEIGSVSALLELRDSLKNRDLDLPYWEHVSGSDTNIQLGILSRFAITARNSHTNETYLLNGRRFHVSRGFADLDIQVNPRYSFTVLSAHLKSKRAIPQADEAEMREEEAKLLRELIDAHFATNADANLVVLGDFNDTKVAPSTRILIGRGRSKLVDTCPAERNGDTQYMPSHSGEPRKVTWTLYYSKEDTFSRVDYILLSPGMAREWVPRETYVPSIPNWGIASDHRPVVAAFEALDK